MEENSHTANPVGEINTIVQGIKNVCITHERRSVKEVRVILAHWDYKSDRVKKYGGIKWIFDHWRDLLKQGGNTMDQICKEKICILSFESGEQICQVKNKDREDTKKANMMKKIEMFMALETVTYIQTPPKKLEDIKRAVKDLSEVSYLSNSTKEVEHCLHEMNCYQELNEYLHDLSHQSYKYDALSLETFEKIKTKLPDRMRNELSNLLYDFQTALGNFPDDSVLGSWIEHDAYKNLNQKVQEGWF